MAKDVVVVVNLDTAPRPAERLDILLISTEGQQDAATYRSLDDIDKVFMGKRILNKAAALFNQGRTTLADSLIRRVKIVGFDPPLESIGSYPVYTITFGTPGFDTPLTPGTEYFVKFGGSTQALVSVTTNTTAPTTAAQMAGLFSGTSFILNGITFTATIGSGGVVTFTGDAKAATVQLSGVVDFFTDNTLSTSVGLQASAYTAVYTNGAPPAAPSDTLIQNITEFRDIDDDWYIFLTDQDSDDFVTALAHYAQESQPTEAELGAGAEDMRKFYFGQTTNLELTGGYARSAIIFVDDPTEEADAAYLGNVGPFWPQSVTWKFKRPQGISLPDLSASDRALLEESNINFLTDEYKNVYVKNGVCWDGEFIDVQLGADYIVQLMRQEHYDVFLQNATIPYDDTGFALVASAVFSSLNRAVTLGIIANDPQSGVGVFNVIVPTRAQATEDQVRNRQMPDILWEAQIAGAVHGVKVRGVLRASL
jgi:hypothetical protein